MILEIQLIPADDLMVQHLYRKSSDGADQPGQLISINVWYDFAPYNHTTVQLPYRTIISRRRRDFVSRILARTVARISCLKARSSYLLVRSLYLIAHSSD